MASAGCASVDANTEFSHGRAALLSGMVDAAIPHLQQATAIDGTLTYSKLKESAWTYLGRAYYDAQKYPPARDAFNRALAVNRDDNLARLYLGLTLTREGGHERSRQEVLAALKGLQDGTDYL